MLQKRSWKVIKGVLSLDWCKQDPTLLLSSGKDNSTFLWNPIEGIKLGEYPTTANWAFETKFAQLLLIFLPLHHLMVKLLFKPFKTPHLLCPLKSPQLTTMNFGVNYQLLRPSSRYLKSNKHLIGLKIQATFHLDLV